MWEDSQYPNDYYSKVGAVPLDELNTLEVEFLEALDYNLYITHDDFGSYLRELVAHAGLCPQHKSGQNAATTASSAEKGECDEGKATGHVQNMDDEKDEITETEEEETETETDEEMASKGSDSASTAPLDDWGLWTVCLEGKGASTFAPANSHKEAGITTSKEIHDNSWLRHPLVVAI